MPRFLSTLAPVAGMLGAATGFVTSASSPPSIAGSGLAARGTVGGAVPPFQRDDTDAVRCPTPGKGRGSARTAPVPCPPRPEILIEGSGSSISRSVLTWDRAASLSRSGAIRVTGLPYRVIDGKAEGVTIDGLYVDPLFRGGVRLAKGSHDVTIRHFRFIHRPDSPNHAPDLPEGIDIQGCTHCVIEEGEIANMQMTGHRYPNGDGLNVEHGVTDVTFRRVYAHRSSDSGFDWLKGRMLRGYDLVSERNARGLKTGAVDARLHDFTCRNDRTCIEFHGGDLAIDGLTIDVTGRTGKTWIISASARTGTANTIDLQRCTVVGGVIRPTADSQVIAIGPGVKLTMDDSCKAALR